MSLLQPGDTVGFVATSSGLEGRDIAPAVNYFEQKLHLKVKLAPNLSYAYRYMAGTDAERGKCLTEMYRNPEVKALFAIRGAGGSSRMLNFLDYDIIARHSKPLFGLSDVTAVQNALVAGASTPAYTGFLPIYDIKNDSLNSELETSLKNILFAPVHCLKSGTSLYPGKAEGQIIGGCLTSFLYLAGTNYMPDLAGKILLIEDTDEKTYKLDLMFSQLKQLKNFDKLHGIIIGAFSDCIVIDSFDGDVDTCIKDFTEGLNIPVISGFNYGHIPDRSIVPLGIPVKMTSAATGCSISW